MDRTLKAYLGDAKSISEGLLGTDQRGAAFGHVLDEAKVRRQIQATRRETFTLSGLPGTFKSPLSAAVLEGQWSLVCEMLARGADPKVCSCRFSNRSCDRYLKDHPCCGQCYLRDAVAHPRIFMALLDRGIQIRGAACIKEVERQEVSLSGFVLLTDREGSALEAMLESSGFDGKVWTSSPKGAHPIPLERFAAGVGREVPRLAESKRWRGVRAAWVSAVLRAPRRPAPAPTP